MNGLGKLVQACCASLLLGLLLSACAATPASTPPADIIDRQWADSMRSARSAYDQGHFRQASRLFSRALERGQQTDRTQDITDSAFNLAATLIALGDYPAAESYLQEAKQENRRSKINSGEIELLEARLARLLNENTRAQSIVKQLQSLNDPLLQLQALLLSGLLACDDGYLLLAQQNLTKAVKLPASSSSPMLAANQAELQGCINRLQEQPLEAAAAFDRQSVKLQQAQQYRQMVAALHQAGDAYTAGGEYQLAADRLFRAARSSFSQKRLQQGLILLDKAQSAAETADDQPLLETIDRLRRRYLEG